MTFYAYAHLRPDLTPFYIGKGRIDRARHLGRRNKYHQRIVAKDGPANIIVELMACGSEAEAFLREELAIKALRAVGVQLTNVTAGGEGPSGFKRGPSPKRGIKLSVEHRAKMSAACMGRRISEAAKAKMSATQKGRKKSPETIERMKAAARLTWGDPAIRARRTLARATRPPYTEASKQKMSVSQRRRHEKEK